MAAFLRATFSERATDSVAALDASPPFTTSTRGGMTSTAANLARHGSAHAMTERRRQIQPTLWVRTVPRACDDALDKVAHNECLVMPLAL